jgi:hypothetical protein
MARRCALDRAPARIGEDDEGPAGVVRAVPALDQSAPFHAGQVVGEAALLPLQRLGELEYADLDVGTVRQRHQDVEVRQGHARVGLELPAELSLQPGLHREVAAPRALLVLVEPAGVGHGLRLPGNLLMCHPVVLGE